MNWLVGKTGLENKYINNVKESYDWIINAGSLFILVELSLKLPLRAISSMCKEEKLLSHTTKTTLNIPAIQYSLLK